MGYFFETKCNNYRVHFLILIAVAIAIVGALAMGRTPPSLAPVGSSYWQLPQGYVLYSLHGPGLQTAAFIAYLALASLLGTLVLIAIIEIESESLADALRWIPLAAFIPGYFAIVAINRLVTFALPNIDAVLLLPLAYLVVAVCLGFPSRHFLTMRNVRLILDGVPRCAAIFMVWLVLQVQTDNSEHILGDGLSRFLEMVRIGTGLGPNEFFPIFGQHYDEIMFLYPFFAPSGMSGEIVEFFWMLYSMGKASALACVIAALLVLCRMRMVSYVVALLAFFGCLSLFGGKTLLLFDSGNPLRANLHVGRIILAILPIVVLSLSISGRVSVRIGTCAGLLGSALVGIGISAISISSIFVLLSIFVGLATLALPISVTASGLSVLSLITLLLVAYSLRGAYGGPLIFLSGIAIFSAVAGCYAARHAKARIAKLTTEAFFPATFSLTMGIAFGLLVLGNSFSYDYLRVLGFGELHKWIYFGKSVPEFAIGFNPFCGRFPLNHCLNLSAFLSSFGLALTLGLAAVLVIWWNATTEVRVGSEISSQSEMMEMGEHRYTQLSKVIACCVVFLVCGFFAYDFTNGSMWGWLPVWLKSRLIEPWIYATLVFSFVALLTSSSRVIRFLAITVLIWQVFVYSMVLAEAPIHMQFIRNGTFLLNKAAGGFVTANAD